MLCFDRMEFLLLGLFRIESELRRHTSCSELFLIALDAYVEVTFDLLDILYGNELKIISIIILLGPDW